jgi:hypothetical protein
LLSDPGSTLNALKPDEGKMKFNREQERQVHDYILAYLCNNPDAGDTFDGIVEWWLLHQRIKFETQNIAEAVRRLVAEGLIVEHREPDSRIIYRVNRTTAKDIQTRLSEPDSAE